MPEKLNYTVTCNSVDAEILHADIQDIYKLLKGDRHVTKFLNDQYMEKYPDQQLTDKYFEQVFSNQGATSSMSQNPAPQTPEAAAVGIPKTIMPAQKNLIAYGINGQVNNLLLNQTELDFRETIKEVVHEYPQTKRQKNMVEKSQFNYMKLQQKRIGEMSSRGPADGKYKTIEVSLDDLECYDKSLLKSKNASPSREDNFGAELSSIGVPDGARAQSRA